ncbi:MAG: glycosyltransferase family 39 protein [Acidimicrobiales bacterium]|nr:glycosyltransferase family 39 protein [Acidimicrobiales bacterium]
MTGEAPPAPGRICPPARTAALLGLLVLVGFVIRIDALRNSAPEVPALGDAKAYHLLAANLADGKGYIRPFEALDGYELKTAEYPPALPVVLAAADLVGVEGTEGQRALLCGVGAITVGLVGLIARRLGGSDGAGYLAAGVAAVHPGLWNADVSLMAEPLASCVGAALVLVALAALDRPAAGRFAALGALAGIGGLVRSELLLIGVALVAAVAVADARRPSSEAGGGAGGGARTLRRVGLGAAGVLVVLVPWTVRNLVAFDGQLVPLSNNSGSVARGANCDAAYRGQYRGLWVTDVALGGTSSDAARAGCFSGFDLVGSDRDEAEVAAQMRRDGLAYAGDHLGELPTVMAARLGRTVGLYQLDQQSNFAFAEGRNATWDRRGTRSFQLLAAIGVVGLVLGLRGGASRARVLLLVPIACSMLVVAFTYGNPRFRAAAEPAVVVLASLAVSDLAARVRARVDAPT